ncbi:hypothetical protein NN561_018645 [Cricetulus griseus]
MPAMTPQPKGPRKRAMPCQREKNEEADFEAEGEDKDDSYLLLQQSVTLGSLTYVDQLIAKIGKTLKLDTAHDGPASPSAAPRPPPLRIQAAISVDQNRSPARQMLGSSVPAENCAPAHPGGIRCMLWDRGRLWSPRLPTAWLSSPRAPAPYALCPCSLALRDLWWQASRAPRCLSQARASGFRCVLGALVVGGHPRFSPVLTLNKVRPSLSLGFFPMLGSCLPFAPITVLASSGPKPPQFSAPVEAIASQGVKDSEVVPVVLCMPGA